MTDEIRVNACQTNPQTPEARAAIEEVIRLTAERLAAEEVNGWDEHAAWWEHAEPVSTSHPEESSS